MVGRWDLDCARLYKWMCIKVAIGCVREVGLLVLGGGEIIAWLANVGGS